jgi:hypothetical protein
MKKTSQFRQLASSVTVSEICTPILAYFDVNQTGEEIWEEWNIDLCDEKGLDPAEQLCLVVDRGKYVGWLDYIIEHKSMKLKLREFMYPITPDLIISSDISLFNTVKVFDANQSAFYLVLKEHDIIGWVTYSDLHKPPLRLCLFAMLINIEKLILSIAMQKPAESFSLLTMQRQEKAKKVYITRQYKFEGVDDFYYSKLLECTTLADKFTFLRKSKIKVKHFPSLLKEEYCKLAERLRNEITHPSYHEQSSNLLTRENLWPFIQWAESLEGELEVYLEKTKEF